MEKCTQDLEAGRPTMSSPSKGSEGIGGCTLLFFIFLTLKLCEVIDWSWWWVTAPLWGPIAVLIAVLVIMAVVAFFILAGVGLWIFLESRR